MNKLEELAKKAYDGRVKKLAYEENPEEAIIELYVEEIINIFIASNQQNEKTIECVYLRSDGKHLEACVAYASNQDEVVHYYSNEGLYQIPEGATKSAVAEMNKHFLDITYKEKIAKYFRCILNEYFDVNTGGQIMLKKPTVC